MCLAGFHSHRVFSGCVWFTLWYVAKWLLCKQWWLQGFHHTRASKWDVKYTAIQLKEHFLCPFLSIICPKVVHEKQTSSQAGRLTSILFSVLLQITGSMNLGLGCVRRPICWPFGSVLDSRHCVFALTLLTLLMQVVVEANSWWYAIIFFPYASNSVSLNLFSVRLWSVFTCHSLFCHTLICK